MGQRAVGAPLRLENRRMYRIRTQILNGQGGPWLSTMFFDEAAGTAQQAATAVGTFWGAIDNFLPSGLAWDVENEVVFVDEASGNPTGLVGVTGPTGTGTIGSEILPTATQVLIRWRTGTYLAGREVRGRTFIPGTTETDAVGGNPSAAMQLAFDAAGAALIADANSALVIWHRPGPGGSPPGSAFVVATATTWNRFAVLRTRRD